MLEGEPEVSADGAEEKAQVLDPERIIESQQRAELPDILLAGFERQEQPRRITGEMQKSETITETPRRTSTLCRSRRRT
jgi:hypothetical protein